MCNILIPFSIPQILEGIDTRRLGTHPWKRDERNTGEQRITFGALCFYNSDSCRLCAESLRSNVLFVVISRVHCVPYSFNITALFIITSLCIIINFVAMLFDVETSLSHFHELTSRNVIFVMLFLRVVRCAHKNKNQWCRDCSLSAIKSGKT